MNIEKGIPIKDYFSLPKFNSFQELLDHAGDEILTYVLTSTNLVEGKATVEVNIGTKVQDIWGRYIITIGEVMFPPLSSREIGRNTDPIIPVDSQKQLRSLTRKAQLALNRLERVLPMLDIPFVVLNPFLTQEFGRGVNTKYAKSLTSRLLT